MRNSQGCATLEHLRPFGCQAFVHFSREVRGKLDRRIAECTLLETVGKSYYKVFDPATSSTFNTKHVIFNEEAFPAKHSRVEDDGAFEVAGDGDHIEGGYESETCSSTSSATLNDASEVIPSIEEQEGQPSGSPPQNPPLDQNEPRQENVEADVEERDHETSEGTIENGIKPSDVTGDGKGVRRYPSRNRKPTDPSWWAHKADGSPCHPGTQPDEEKQLCHNQREEKNDSPTISQAMKSEEKHEWMLAIQEELEALKKANTWNPSPVPPGARVLPSNFVSKIKRESAGSIERYKASLVGLGNLQRPNIDFFESYAPVIDFSAVRLLMTIACVKGLVIHQVDVKSAFLYGELDEDIYITLPKAIETDPGKTYKLRKSLYGLKQAPKAWFEKVTSDLESIGFRSAQTVEGLYIRKGDKNTAYLVLYVDDMLIFTEEEDEARR